MAQATDQRAGLKSPIHTGLVLSRSNAWWIERSYYR